MLFVVSVGRVFIVMPHLQLRSIYSSKLCGVIVQTIIIPKSAVKQNPSERDIAHIGSYIKDGIAVSTTHDQTITLQVHCGRRLFLAKMTLTLNNDI